MISDKNWKENNNKKNAVPEDDSSEDSLEDNCENSSDDNFEMKVVPEMKKQVRSSKVCALQDRTKSYIR